MNNQKEIIKVCDGIVIIRNSLSHEEQQKLVDIVENFGKLFDDDGIPNFSKNRARNYSNLDDYGEETKTYMKNICNKTMTYVKSVDKVMPNADVTHLLTLCYVTKIGMGFHKDDGRNDGDFDTPVISFTIGNSCIFEHKIDDQVYANQLNSGDVIVFGGPQRMVWHRVKKVLKNTVPDYLKLDDVRINLTFRQATSIIGKEDEHTTDKYLEYLKEERANKI